MYFYFKGGCSKTEKLPSTLKCFPECTIDNSYCNDTNFCACEDKYDSYYRQRTLIGCEMANETLITSEQKTEGKPGKL